MESLLSGHVLLVGEGDFSFAVSLVGKLLSNKCLSILATSLETEQSIKKHQHAYSNISWLKGKGVTVRLEIDATKLHDNPFTSGEKFDCIVFNFPHAGGKSNHKKNRKLLNDFFASAVQVLKSQGQILMTLCKGQGGTPADRPMRAWHDSWQVVSMAANSDLILTKIVPFKAEEYTVYTSTGFRSLDKGFHTENALTHVFEVAEPVFTPTTVDNVIIKADTHLLSCPPYIYRKLEQIRNINSNNDHPVNRLYECIVQNLHNTDAKLKIENIGIQPAITQVRSTIAGENSVILNPCNATLESEGSEQSGLVTAHNMSALVCDAISTDPGDRGDKYTVVSDPLNIVKEAQSEHIQVQYGPVFKPGLISGNQSVISYNLNILWPVIPDKDLLQGPTSFHEEFTKTIYETGEILMKILNNVISKSDCIAMLVSQTDSGSLRSDSGKVLHTADVVICNSSQQSSVSKGEENKQPNKIGVCHFKNSSEEAGQCKAHIYFTVDLCKLACNKYDVENEKLLWSDDSKVLRQFTELECDKEASCEDSQCIAIGSEQDVVNSACSKQSRTYGICSPSVYPMMFQHDMSFWENPSLLFNEMEYCNIIRDIAGDSVINVELIDEYTESASGRSSRCYRLTFQSVDKALSYDTSWKLQSLIRLEVAKKMKIILR